MMNISIVLILYAFVFILSEFTYRKLHTSFLFSRKTAHILGSVVSFLTPYFVSNTSIVALGIFFALVIFISKRKYLFKGIHYKTGLGIGEIVFPLGIAVSALIIWPLSVYAYQGACLVLGFSDGLAGYVGSIYGNRGYTLFGGRKTFRGSAVFFLITLAIFFFYYLTVGGPASFLILILIPIYAMGITIVEASLISGWDNLFIPLTAGFALLSILS